VADGNTDAIFPKFSDFSKEDFYLIGALHQDPEKKQFTLLLLIKNTQLFKNVIFAPILVLSIKILVLTQKK